MTWRVSTTSGELGSFGRLFRFHPDTANCTGRVIYAGTAAGPCSSDFATTPVVPTPGFVEPLHVAPN